MTIIVTVALPSVVVQASDRLITKKPHAKSNKYKLHDPTSNKSVIYCGSGCKLILGYTGDAYVGNLPTDLWMTKKLWGQEFHDLASFSFRQPAMLLNANEVGELFAGSSELPAGVTISIGGHQRTRRGDVPRLWTVRRGEVSPVPQDALLDRGFLYMQGIEIPAGWSRTPEQRELITTIRGRGGSDWKVLRSALVTYIRRISTHSDAVGSDVLVVATDRNDRFFSTSLHLSDESKVEAGMTYIPSAVFPGVLIPPARIVDTRLSIMIGPGYVKAPPGPSQNRREFMYVQNSVGPPSLNASWFDHTRPGPPTKW